MSSRKVTIIDVAKEAGVSIASVSRFLNNPFSLREANRKKIADAVKKLNYRPLIHAQRLAGGKLDTFGLIIPGYEGIFTSFYSLEILRGVGMSLENKGIDLHINIFWHKDNFKASLVDGVIFADIINNEAQLRRILKEGIPAVVINRKVDEIDVSYVAIDNFKGAYDATDFIIKHGHKYIAHIAGDLNAQCARERLEGFKEALADNKSKVKDEFIKIANFSRIQAREAIEELFSLKTVPTAVFCASDEMAQEVLQFARENNISVPRRLAVVGFDDNPTCIYGEVALTTVRQPLKKMASLGVDILNNLVNKKQKGLQKIVLPPELVIRDTVDFI